MRSIPHPSGQSVDTLAARRFRGGVSGGSMTSGRPRLAAVRRAVGLAVVLVLLGCAFAFYRAAPTLPKSTVPAPASAADATPTSGPTTPAPTSAEPASPKRRAGATARRDAATGPGRTAVGIHLTASPAADGSFDVAESVVLSSPVSVLKLRVPPIGTAARSSGPWTPGRPRYKSARVAGR